MRVMIVGGSGFVGRALRRELSARGHETIVASRRQQPVSGGSSTYVDLTSQTSVDELDLQGADAVCNLAACIPSESTPSTTEECYAINAIGAERLAARAAAAGCSRFIHVASGNAYHPDELYPGEAAQLYPFRHATAYLSSKVAGEILVRGVGHRSGMPVSIVRPSSVYGPGMDRSSVLAKFVELAAEQRAITVTGDGSRRADFVFLDDVAGFIADVLEREADGAWNVGSGQATSILELAHTITDVFRSSSAIHVLEPDAGCPPSGFHALDISRAVQRLGFSATPLARGLETMQLRRRSSAS
jgi:UDP-glucose 4-epimerase